MSVTKILNDKNTTDPVLLAFAFWHYLTKGGAWTVAAHRLTHDQLPSSAKKAFWRQTPPFLPHFPKNQFIFLQPPF